MFNENALEYLKSTYIFSVINSYKEYMRSDYDKICKHVPEFSKHNFNQYQKALLTSKSRCFEVRTLGAQ